MNEITTSNIKSNEVNEMKMKENNLILYKLQKEINIFKNSFKIFNLISQLINNSLKKVQNKTRPILVSFKNMDDKYTFPIT